MAACPRSPPTAIAGAAGRGAGGAAGAGAVAGAGAGAPGAPAGVSWALHRSS
jgi:hypothetical protein